MPRLGRLRGRLRQWRDRWFRHPLADELERSRRENDQLQSLLAELPEIFERKYQQRLEPLLEHQYRLLEDNALLMDQLRLLQGRPVPDVQLLGAVDSPVAAAAPPPASTEPSSPAMATASSTDPFGAPEDPQPVSASGEGSVHLEVSAPLADVSSLLHSPPWGVPGPSLIQSQSRSEPSAAPRPVEPTPPPPAVQAVPSFEELVSLASQQLETTESVGAADGATVSGSDSAPWNESSQAGVADPLRPTWSAHVQEPSEALLSPQPVPLVPIDPMAPLTSRAPWLEPEPPALDPPAAPPLPEVAAGQALAAEAPVWSSKPEVSPPIAATGAPEPTLGGQAELVDPDSDPLDQARARKLQAWRRARRQG